MEIDEVSILVLELTEVIHDPSGLVVLPAQERVIPITERGRVVDHVGSVGDIAVCLLATQKPVASEEGTKSPQFGQILSELEEGLRAVPFGL